MLLRKNLSELNICVCVCFNNNTQNLILDKNSPVALAAVLSNAVVLLLLLVVMVVVVVLIPCLPLLSLFNVLGLVMLFST